MEYLPFGETLVDEHINSNNSPFKYNGKEYDAETGNYYYGARYYDPKFSIFISVDPLVEDTWDAYGYCYQNPINLVDPRGLEGEDPNNPEPSRWNKFCNWISNIFSSKKDKHSSTDGDKCSVKCEPGTWSFKGVPDITTLAETSEVVETATAVETAASLSTLAAGSSALLLLTHSDSRELTEEDYKVYLYRNMKPVDGGFLGLKTYPMLGQGANYLGLRPVDVSLRSFDEIISGYDPDGLSVTIGYGSYKSDSVRPSEVNNYSSKKTVMFRIEPKDLIPMGLKVTPCPRADAPNYARITPLFDMTIHEFHRRIQSTQVLWHPAPTNY